ncbi:hypothetical protein CH251_13975 [Rhodococcus sp. 06-462-5]|uniref:DUF3089 domain-containing protein n=1 Tax=unclassified Rhodococcus (in: high G+C Gram-positive bacteria) TaxID=192944 RepID=UPI000B9BA02B|nr:MULTISPECIES: DUF3089 domain-containing protein [unclassified Rhodococcus (in: high G+C Gram-positive bacteria)]OZC73638.1 hypothetical protein CH251_13975 [Rhodococcus sp. 06-462-5]OZE63447.1 hypothetical protein CH270_18350 [Rhodococcus sp. 02-925g]
MRRRAKATLLSLVLVAGGLVAAGTATAQPAPTTTWLCNPDIANDPCDLPGDTTDLGTNSTTPAPAAVPDSGKPIDCFYLYPTVTNDVALNAPGYATPEVASIASFQAARFNTQCRVFAPIYRQTPLLMLPPALLGAAGPSIDLAYADVRAAWDNYMATENNGRGVLLVGHSQGTFMLRKLMRETFDRDAALRTQLVGAFLMGGNVETARGSTTGGDFQNIPLCTERAQFGCVVAYSTNTLRPPLSTFGNANIDLWSQRWGLPSGPGYQVACTDPAKLSGDNRPVGVTVPSAPFAFGIISILLNYTTAPEALPTSKSTWTTSRGRVVGSCIDTGGYNQYHLQFVVPQPLNEVPLLDSHLIDMNAGLDRLVSIAGQQATAWQSAR